MFGLCAKPDAFTAKDGIRRLTFTAGLVTVRIALPTMRPGGVLARQSTRFALANEERINKIFERKRGGKTNMQVKSPAEYSLQTIFRFLQKWHVVFGVGSPGPLKPLKTRLTAGFPFREEGGFTLTGE